MLADLVLAAAAADVPKAPEWYEVLAGIIALPGAIVGIFGGVALYKKLNVEAEKTQLETRKLARELGEAPPDTQAAVEQFLQPLVQTRRIETLLLRFIFLYLALLLFHALFDLIEAMVFGVAQGVSGGDLDLGHPVFLVLFGFVPNLGSVFITVLIGVPLLREIAKVLNVSLPLSRRKRRAATRHPAGDTDEPA
jgi:hypothetical protein